MAQLVKTVAGLAIASVKTVNGLAIASAKTIAGLDNTSGGGGAPAFGAETDRIVGAFTASGTTKAYTLTTGIAAGKGVSILLFYDDPSLTISSVVDDVGGNTYNVDVTSTSNQVRCVAISSVLTNALSVGSIITVTFSATYSFLVNGVIISRLDNITALDTTGTFSDFNDTVSISLTTSAATVAICGIATPNGSASTVSVDGTQIGAAFAIGAALTGIGVYKDNATSGSKTIGAVMNDARNIRCVGAAYK